MTAAATASWRKRTVVSRLAGKWKTTYCVCSNCGLAVDPSTVGEGEQAGWCPHCEQVFKLPLLKVPGWIAGVVVLLAARLQVGF